MAAVTRYATAISALSLLSAVTAEAFPGLEACAPTTTTVYTTVTVDGDWEQSSSSADYGSKPTTTAAAAKGSNSPVGGYSVTQQYTPPADYTYPGVSFPTYGPSSLNPNGPFYNPNDYIPFYLDWPGKPTKDNQAVPPLPKKAPHPIGGSAAGEYMSPAWQQKGSNLKPGLSQQDTNGDSKWGLIDCPRLSSYVGAPGGSVSASSTMGYGSHYTSAPGYASHTSSAGHVSYPSSAPHSVYSSAWPSASSGFSTYSVHGNHSMSSSSSSAPTSSPTSWSSSSSSWSSLSSASNSSSQCSANSTDTSAICGVMPDTGVTRSYDFHVSYGVIAPDGVQKNGLLVNNQFPGPMIEANWGDWIEVKVTNDLPAESQDQGEGTSLHWHGFVQHETPYYDGVPSVQQCPLAPEKSLTYRFRADHVGTSWYHSHYSAQYAGGALGPIVIHGPPIPGACYDEDLGPVMVGDWYHADYYSLVEVTMAGGLALSDNVLINGKMNYPCENTTAVCTPNAGVSKFQFTPGKKYRMRLINPSAEAVIKFHIDGHSFTVIANDFIPIKPYETNVITLGVGQRSDVIVEAVGKKGDAYWMRATAGDALAGTGCSAISGVVPEGVAAVYYDGADTDSEPTTSSDATTAQLTTCENDDLSLTQALCPVALSDESQVFEEDMLIEFKSNGTNFVWYMANSSFRADYNVNLLEHVISGNRTFEPQWNVHTYDDASKDSVRIVVENNFFLPHPMHLHGHDFNVLASGVGTWDGTITNPSNTQVRDVHLLPGAGAAGNGFMVLQFKKDNPAVWPFHCHIAWHVSAGLYVNVLEAPSEISYQVPSLVQDTCSDWAAWQAQGNIANQIDSGL